MNSRILILLSTLLLFSLTAVADKTVGQGIDDSTIQAEVKAKLLGDDFFGGLDANLEVRKGVVQLGGWVEKAEESTGPAKIAATVDGVVKVDNQLHEKRGKASIGQKVDDGLITTSTKAAISDMDLGTGFKVNVDTYNGVVLLTGFVNSKEDHDAVGKKAAGVDNVKDVINGTYVLN